VRIPKSFMLAGNIWEVHLKTKRQMVDGEDDCHGLCYNHLNEIWLLKDLDPVSMEQTFLHEAAHSVMFTMGFIDHDEVFVEGVAQLVYQMLLTGEYDDIEDDSPPEGD